MTITIFEKLLEKGLISEDSFSKVKSAESSKLFSIHWELRTVLYLGVLLLTSGLGILVYKNIDTIGHQAILAFIALITGACFYYCEKKKPPFSRGKVLSPNAFFDYVLLLGCLTMLTFIAYLQAQYNVFGDRFGLATFIPMLILFFCAYYFDHLGVLSLAIANLAAWMGLAVTPLAIFKSNNFADAELIFAGIILGVFLIVVSHFTTNKTFKAHFSFTYLNFGMNIAFIATLAGMFRFDSFYIVWILPLAALVFYFYKRALQLRSFYLILMLTMYGYIGLAYVFIRVFATFFIEAYAIVLLFFIASAVGLVLFLIDMNKKIKKDARIQ